MHNTITMSDTKNVIEESDTSIPTEEKKETLQLQKNHPTETDKNVKITVIKLRNNALPVESCSKHLAPIPKKTKDKHHAN